MKLECHIVKDLLPNYVDNLTSNETTNDIKSHLKSCNICNSEYQKMQKPIRQQSTKSKNLDEIKYLGKFNKKYSFLRKSIICLGIFSAILFIGLIFTFFKAYQLQYNNDLISNYLTISINPNKGVEYIGKYENYQVYTYQLEETYFIDFFDNHINLKEALKNGSVSLNDITKYLTLMENNNSIKVYIFENYQVIFSNGLCIVAPVSLSSQEVINEINSSFE